MPVCYPGQECPGGLIFNGPVDSVIDKQLAAFGEVTFKFLDHTQGHRGPAGVPKLEFNGTVCGNRADSSARRSSTSGGASEKPVTPKAVFAWEPNHDNNIYASASKGFRPGGPNVAVGTICGGSLSAIGVSQVPGQYSSDSLWSYELGSKNSFFDHTLAINASIFYIDWTNIQQNVYLPTCGEQFTANLGKAKSEGGDLEVLFRPLTQLTFDLTAAYTDARLTKTSCAGTLDYNAARDACVGSGLVARPIATNGDALLGAPWTFTASGEYHFPDWQRQTSPICDSMYSMQRHSDPCYPKAKIRTTHYSTPPCRGCRSSTTCRCAPAFASMGWMSPCTRTM